MSEDRIVEYAIQILDDLRREGISVDDMIEVLDGAHFMIVSGSQYTRGHDYSPPDNEVKPTPNNTRQLSHEGR